VKPRNGLKTYFHNIVKPHFQSKNLKRSIAVVEGAADYEQFIRTLNAVIAKYAVKHRHHHNAEPANGQPEGAQNDA
jgi:hypothetical protein